MATRPSTLALSLAAVLALASSAPAGPARPVKSTNFIVEAPTEDLAREFARLAEKYRKEKAIEWLGREMPNWPYLCPLRVTVLPQGASGATTFRFERNYIFQEMHIEGQLERLKNSVLPHEITHTVFAHHFRQPVPRWADEGGAVYSEDDVERRRHDQMCNQILRAGRGIPLRRMFNLKEYPDDVMVLYAEGYSVTRFLIESSDRQTFLNFVATGMDPYQGWDKAVRSFYGYRSVDELENAWLDHLKRGGTAAVARGNGPASAQPTSTAADNRLRVRESAWPSQPDLDPPAVARGQAPAARPEPGRDRDRDLAASGWNRPAASLGVPQPVNEAPRTTPADPVRTVAAPAKPRHAPPPVVLFPPEPLPD